jgi:hypothetical protein
MDRLVVYALGFALFVPQAGPVIAQIAGRPVSSENAPSVPSVDLAPIEHPATPDQIREYLKLSGEMGAWRARWIEAVDKNRSIGEPYWPESFWTAIKDDLRTADLVPMYIIWYQHTVSKNLMGRVLDAYHRLGPIQFQNSAEARELHAAKLRTESDANRLSLAKTDDEIKKIYQLYKPKIKEERARYLAEHPGWTDK